MNGLKIIGHRGARGLSPENTLAALKAGMDNGADMLEFDLQVSSDGSVILNHNPYIRTDSGQDLDIKRNPYKTLKSAKPDLATFDEALSLTAGKLPLYVEVKAGVKTGPIIEVLQRRFKDHPKKDRIFLASFSQKTLRELHKALPEVPKIVIEKWSGVRAARRARQIDAKIIAMDQHWLWSGYIKAASRHYTLYTYTLNNPAKADKWARYGLAGVVTDYPDRFKRS